jgi:hypothetical protein
MPFGHRDSKIMTKPPVSVSANQGGAQPPIWGGKAVFQGPLGESGKPKSQNIEIPKFPAVEAWTLGHASGSSTRFLRKHRGPFRRPDSRPWPSFRARRIEARATVKFTMLRDPREPAVAPLKSHDNSAFRWLNCQTNAHYIDSLISTEVPTAMASSCHQGDGA